LRFCPLYSGSSGNALLVLADGAAILVDAGLPGRVVAEALAAAGVAPEQLSGILVTHEHSDHVKGVGILARRYRLPVYANAGTWRGMLPLIGEIPPAQVRVFETERDFYLGGINVLPYKTPHDANESVGFVFQSGGSKLSILTDAGHINERMLDAVSGSGLILIESNHDVEMLKAGRYPFPLKRRILGDEGHLSNDACGAALTALYGRGVRRAVLGHLSRENNFESLALETVRAALRASDVPDEAFALSVAHRDRVGEIYEVD
jgi:beta-lactamase-like protein